MWCLGHYIEECLLARPAQFEIVKWISALFEHFLVVFLITRSFDLFQGNLDALRVWLADPEDREAADLSEVVSSLYLLLGLCRHVHPLQHSESSQYKNLARPSPAPHLEIIRLERELWEVHAGRFEGRQAGFLTLTWRLLSRRGGGGSGLVRHLCWIWKKKR